MLAQLRAKLPDDDPVIYAGNKEGYGFIHPDDNSSDAFVHVTALERAGIPGLAEGQKVSYDLEKGRDGKISATNVQLL